MDHGVTVEARLLVGLVMSVGVVFLTTPLVIRIAAHLGFYDRPAGYKGHSQPTPYLGGAAVMVGFVAALLTVTGNSSRTLPLVLGAVVLWTVGTIDDRRTVAPGWRVAVEAAVAGMLWSNGLGWQLGLGTAVDLVLTVLWIVALVNAFNLFDNMDGAASSMVLVVSIGVFLLAAGKGDGWLMVTAAVLGGACLGFLPHNLTSPARIFLGDGGSMPLGFTVAALTMAGASDAVSAWPALIVGLLLVGVPAFDTWLVIVSRTRRGISVLTGGRDHLTHRTRARLGTARAVAMALGAVQALLSALAVFASQQGPAVLVLAVLLYLALAGTAFVILDGSRTGTQREAALSAGAEPPATSGPRGIRSPTGWLIAVFGVGLGASSFVGGYYDPSVWIPLGISLVVLVMAVVLADHRRLSAPALLIVGSLLALAGWSVLSTSWSDSVERALVEANRYLVLCGLATGSALLVRGRRESVWMLGAVAVGIAAVAVTVSWRLLGAHPQDLFLGGRLNEPLGYINAQGTVFLMGFWVFMALAEQRRPVFAGLGLGGTTLLGSLAVLSQSRGVVLAMIVSLFVVLALAPGRLRRCGALVLVAASLVLEGRPLLHVYEMGRLGAVTTAAAHASGLAILLATILVGFLWAALVAGHESVIHQRSELIIPLRRAATVLLCVALLCGLAVATTAATRIERSARTQWHAFTHLSEPAGTPATVGTEQTRLVSGAGNRYDYWRVAWQVWRSRPLLGVGAGNYDVPYYSARSTIEDVRQPHSVELQALSELGAVGFALLVVFVAGLAWGAWRMRVLARGVGQERTLMVASVGATSAWLTHTSVDWIHLLPGVTGIALALASIMVRGRREGHAMAEATTPRRGTPRLVLASTGIAVTLALAGFSLTRQGLAQFYSTRAQDALRQRPADAILNADRALRLDSYRVETYYTKAAGLAAFNQPAAAEATLLQATQEEPRNFVTWALLGDIAVRTGDLRLARHYYGRAHALNSRDPSLAQLARDPRSALSPGPNS